MIGALNRGGEVRSEVIEDTTLATLQGYVKTNVADDSTVFTYSAMAYSGLRWNFEYGYTDHSLGEYVNGIIHTNGIEGFWALLKRSIKGTYVAIAPKHLGRYVDERAFAYNNRQERDFGRFELALNTIAGRRLTYAELTGKA